NPHRSRQPELKPGFRADCRISPTRTRHHRACGAACRRTNGRACAAPDHASDSRSANRTTGDVTPCASAFATTLHLDMVRGDVEAAAPDVHRLYLQEDAIATSRIRGSANVDDFERRRRPAWDNDLAAAVEQGIINGRRDPHADEGVPGGNRMGQSNVQHRPGRDDLGAGNRVSGPRSDRHQQADQDNVPTGPHTFTAPSLSPLYRIW